MPEQTTTRAELTVMLARALALPAVAIDSPFRDTHGTWAERVIASAYASGLVSAITETEFAPNQQLTQHP
jgi:hypothetical protein